MAVAVEGRVLVGWGGHCTGVGCSSTLEGLARPGKDGCGIRGRIVTNQQKRLTVEQLHDALT